MSIFSILSVDRRKAEAEAMEVADLVIKYQSRGVVTLDLCRGPSHGDISIYREVFKKARLHVLKLKLHFAEVPSSLTEQELKSLHSHQPEIKAFVVGIVPAQSCTIDGQKLKPGKISDSSYL